MSVPPDEITAEQLKANAEYYRKLNQQLIQKDNIIKLLQLKLKNFETEPCRGEVAAGPVTPDDDGSSRLRRPGKPDLEAEAEKLRILAARLADLEKTNEKLGAELERSREAISSRDRAIAELRARKTVAEPAVPSRELERLRSQLAERDKELDRCKGELAGLRAQPHWTPGNDPILKEELAAAEREIGQARDEVTRLKAQVAELSARPRPEPQPQPPETPSHLGIVKSIIDLMARADEIASRFPGEAEGDLAVFQAQLHDLARAAGIERIRTVGTRFDPKLHQAVEMVYSSEYEHSTVLGEAAPGYFAGEVVVRLADVIVTLNPLHCPNCDKVAPEGSRFCHSCGGRVLGREKEGVRILDERSSCLSQIEMGVAHELVGRLDQARTAFAKALTIDQSQPRALSGMARVAETEGRYEEALELIERILTLGPDPLALRARARLRTKLEILNRLKDLA